MSWRRRDLLSRKSQRAVPWAPQPKTFVANFLVGPFQVENKTKPKEIQKLRSLRSLLLSSQAGRPFPRGAFLSSVALRLHPARGLSRVLPAMIS